jgi:carbon monoxide dehydrogenase subunit G
MGHLGGSASVEIDAPLVEVWAVVQDVMAAPQWQCGLDAVTVTALERDADVIDSEVDIKVGRVKSRVRIRCEGPARLSWMQEKGDMRSVEAVWELEDLGNGRTRVSYRFDADPGRVLGLVIRGPVLPATRAIFVNGRRGELRRRCRGWLAACLPLACRRCRGRQRRQLAQGGEDAVSEYIEVGHSGAIGV